jgi:hypothetical protein
MAEKMREPEFYVIEQMVVKVLQAINGQMNIIRILVKLREVNHLN